MALFSKEKESDKIKIENLIKEVEELRSLTPSIGEFFADQDYSCLWEDEAVDGGIIKYMPLVSVILGLLTVILLFVKK